MQAEKTGNLEKLKEVKKRETSKLRWIASVMAAIEMLLEILKTTVKDRKL